MSFVRALRADLVERRLWPFALALVIGLVAIPVLLLRSPAPAPSPAPVSTADRAAAVAAALPVVNLTATPSAGPGISGRGRNPFLSSQSQPTSATSGTTGAQGHPGTSTPGGSAGTGPAGPHGGTTGPSGPGSTTIPGLPPGPGHRAPANQLVLRVGLAGHLTTMTVDIPVAGSQRVVAVPSRDRPYAVLLGVTAKAHRAIFLLSGEQILNPNADCRPDQNDCREVALGPGDDIVFNVVAARGHLARYVIAVRSIRLPGGQVAATAASASPAPTAGSSPAGPTTFDGLVPLL